MAAGRAECAGGVMFTAGAGLWDAGSAARWAELCRCGDGEIQEEEDEEAGGEQGSGPLLLMVPSLQPEECMRWYGPGEVRL